jgi:hypothetical protein
MATQRISPVGCGRLPGRTHPSLFETTPEGDVRVLAHFVSVEAMHAFLAHQPRVNQAAVAGESEAGDD